MVQRVGELNRRIVLQSPNHSQNESGEIVEGWTDEATVWAQIVPKSAREFYKSDKITSKVDGFFRIRYRTGVEPMWRVRMDDTATSPVTARTFALVGVQRPLDGRKELHLMFVELPSGEPV